MASKRALYEGLRILLRYPNTCPVGVEEVEIMFNMDTKGPPLDAIRVDGPPPSLMSSDEAAILIALGWNYQPNNIWEIPV